MRFEVADQLSLLIVHYRGESLECPSHLWKRMNGKRGEKSRGFTTEDIFAPINEYLATVKPMAVARIFELYQQAHLFLEKDPTFIEAQSYLTDICTQIFDQIDYDHLTAWVAEYGETAYNETIKEEYDNSYERRETYIKSEYDELAVLSTVLKLATPIFGLYLCHPLTKGEKFNELNGYDLLSRSYLHDLPAMARLKDYCMALADKKKKSMMPAICREIGSNETPRYLVAVLIVRRLSVGRTRDPDKTLIKVAFMFLDSKLSGFTFGMRDKKNTQPDNDEQNSTAERYRTSQNITDAQVVIAEEAALNVEKMARAISPTADLRKAQEYVDYLLQHPNFEHDEFHLVFIGLVCDRVYHTRMAKLISREAYLSLIGVTSAALSDAGFQNIADMLMADREPRELETMDIGSAGGLGFSKLTNENKERLEALYPNPMVSGSKEVNPALTMFSIVIQRLNQYSWPNSEVVPFDLKNIMVELLCRREDELNRQYNLTPNT